MHRLVRVNNLHRAQSKALLTLVVSHMEPDLRTFKMCFVVDNTLFGAMIYCPSTRSKTVLMRPNSFTMRGSLSTKIKSPIE